jgi:alpha-tubulin suppressor-like RCC1 family protein
MEHSMLLTVNGEVFTAGNNTRGQLGILEQVSHVVFLVTKVNPKTSICWSQIPPETEDSESDMWRVS